ncbi:hypothetical protein WMY93_007191 [Mugilogobius chulae]|uniref:Uncharacterized protein n=1 Tax=Mugilogobius chulae TaxID=88201 RepID=A0AAW0PQL3_9GOBI
MDLIGPGQITADKLEPSFEHAMKAGQIISCLDRKQQRDAMIRTSVFLFFVLTNGITAKPLKPWDELTNEAVQKGWVSIDDKGMASWGVQVEPPEDMDETSFDIHPSMKIWKSEQSKRYQMAEKDVDDLQHPATEDLLKPT